MTNCPRCHQPLDRTTEHPALKGLMLVRCKACRKFAVEPPEGIDWEWLDGGENLVNRLLASHAAAVNTVAIRESDSDDPRWGA